MNQALKTIFSLIGIAVAVFLLWYIRTIITYVLVAIVLSLIGTPLTELIEKLKIKNFTIPSAMSAAITLVAMLMVVVGFLSLFAPLVAKEARLISSIDTQQVASNLEEPLTAMESWVNQYSLSSDPDESSSEYIKGRLSGMVDVSQVSDVLGTLVGTLGNLFVAVISIFFITFFLLKDRDIAGNFVDAITPDKYLEKVRNILVNIKKTLTRYFVGILIQVTVVTTVISIALMILGVQNALVIGLFAGIVNVIPYVGPFIGAAFGILIGVSTSLELDFYTELIPLALKIASVFLGMQLLDNFVLQPIIFSNSVNIHPLEVFLVVLIAGTLVGITGMILAIPSYSFIRIIAKEFLSQFKAVQSLTQNMD